MDFSRRDVHTNVLKASKYSQLTIDDDFNIPDTKGDIEKIIAKDGYAITEELVIEDGKIHITGQVYFKVLYKTVGDRPTMEVYEGDIPFEDYINVDGIGRNNQGECHCKIEDLTVSMINSRKLEVRGLIGNNVKVYENVSVNAAVDLLNGQGIECQYKNAIITDTVLSKHDAFKLREEVDIPQNKPNIKEILWYSVAIRNMETRPLDEKIGIRGEVEIFVMYRGQEEHLPVQYLFSVRSISKELECQGVDEDMILVAECALGKGEVSIRPDDDGEDRRIGVDYSVGMDIKVYFDNDVKLLSDMYSPQLEIRPEKKEFSYENLLMQNCAKAKVSFRKRLSAEQGKILSICHVYGDVELDNVSIKGNTYAECKDVEVSGVVKACVMYISADDEPMNCMEVDIPFEYTVDTVELRSTDSVRITSCLDQLNATLLNSEEMEIKAQVNMGISIFQKTNSNVIIDMEVAPIDYEKKAAMPGIVGYIVKKDDTVWSIARQFYATTESIRKLNNLESDLIREGDRLIVVKS